MYFNPRAAHKPLVSFVCAPGETKNDDSFGNKTGTVLGVIFLGSASALRFTRGYRILNSIHLLDKLWHWHWTVLLKLLALLIGIALSAILGLYCWKYRPQLSKDEPDVTPTDEDALAIQTPS